MEGVVAKIEEVAVLIPTKRSFPWRSLCGLSSAPTPQINLAKGGRMEGMQGTERVSTSFAWPPSSLYARAQAVLETANSFIIWRWNSFVAQ